MTTTLHTVRPGPKRDLVPVPPATSPYDRYAWLYDLVVGSWPYHRLAWGTSPRVHCQFVREALGQSGRGRLLDAGCGSLLFSAAAYRQMLPAGAHLTLLDASSAMLERGRRRLGPFGTSERVALRVGDLCQLPFEVGAVQRIFHFGVLHCLDQPSRALSEFRRALHPLGELWLSSLVLGRPLGDRLLGRLHEGRHIGVPKSAQEVLDLVQSEGFRVERHWTRGSLLFLRAAHRH